MIPNLSQEWRLAEHSHDKHSQTMKSKDKITRDGDVYYTVAGTAKSLGITKTKVKELMGQKQLDWTQFKSDGPLYITAKSRVAHLSR